MWLFELLIIALMLAINALFAAYELALASVRPARLKELADQKRHGARAAMAMKDRMEASLAVVQLGITLAGAIAAAIGGVRFEESLSPKIAAWLGVSDPLANFLALTLLVIPLSAITIVLGELVPKVIAIHHPESVCLRLSPIMQAFSGLVYPIVWVFEQITKLLIRLLHSFLPGSGQSQTTSGIGDLRAQLGMLRTSKIIGMQEERIILQACRMTSTRVQQVMLAVEDIVMMQADAPLTECLITAHLELHTRFPVCEKSGDPQTILGYVNFKEMVYLAKTHPTHPSLRAILRPLIRFSQQITVSDALQQMVSQHVHLALVHDENQRIVGMLTQEDVFEELVGDIQDEFDRLPRHITPSGKQWIVGGGATLERLRQTTQRSDLAPGLPDQASVSDWVIGQSRHPVKGGDTFDFDNNVHLLIRKVRRHRVTELTLDLAPLPPLSLPSSSPLH